MSEPGVVREAAFVQGLQAAPAATAERGRVSAPWQLGVPAGCRLRGCSVRLGDGRDPSSHC